MIINCETIIEALGDLPPTPVVAVRVVTLMKEDPWVSAQSLADAISYDAAVAARVLRVANSPMFYTGQKIATVKQAVVSLGDSVVKNLVLETSMRAISKSFGLMERRLWEESVGCALAAKLIAQQFDAGDPEEAFFAGLFHNVGKVVMNNHSKEAYKQIVEAAERGEGSQVDMERAFFAFSHEEVGAAVLEKWQFAPTQVLTTLHYRDFVLPVEIEPDLRRAVAVVNVASGLCRYLGIGCKSAEADMDLTQLAGVALLGLSREQIAPLVEAFKVSHKEDRAMFLL